MTTGYLMIDWLHDWNVSTREARQIQERFRTQIVERPLPGSVETVAGVDISFNRGSSDLFAAIAVLSFPELQIMEVARARCRVEFPYVPGLLSFREGPPVMAAWERLQRNPDVLIFDGQGKAHPRRFGLACHLGLLLDKPSIGCAKRRLVGDCEMPGINRGDRTTLWHNGEEIGAVVRTRRNVKPVFVSAGHLTNLKSACQLVLACSRFRQPEPTRQAHRLVNKYRHDMT